MPYYQIKGWYHSEERGYQEIDVIAKAINQEMAVTNLNLTGGGWCRGYPVVKPAPEDRVNRLISAPALPGFERIAKIIGPREGKRG